MNMNRRNSEENIELGNQVRSMRSVFLRIIGILIIPLVVMGVAVCIFENIYFKRILEDEVKHELRTAAYGLSEYYNMLENGDYSKKDDGEVYKGTLPVSGRLGKMGSEMIKAGLDATFFYENVRIDTTITDVSGANMTGTKLDEEIYSRICETGEEVFVDSYELGGRYYYGYYVPFINSNGEIKAIFFAGRPQIEVFADAREYTLKLLWVVLVILIAGIVVSLLCTIYIVSFIFKRIREEDDTNIRKISAKNQVDFMTLVTREVRDPVDSITILSDKILEEESTPRIREKVLGIKEASNSMMISFNSISDYSKLESGDTAVIPDEYEVTKLVRECCDKVAPGIERKNLEFTLNYNESMPNCLKGDYGKIRRILDNLLENAVKYTYDGSIRLDIDFRTITPDKIDVSFTIKDTGVGIRKEDAEKLFYSIGKVGQNKNVSIKGTGLGLLICKRLVSILDGRISVDSEIGKGSTFTFTVPQDVLNRKTVGEYLHNDI